MNHRFSKVFSFGLCASLVFTTFAPAIKTKAAAPVSDLLITEVVPDILGAEDYEYFEIHNPTNAPLDLSNYYVSYIYTDGSHSDVELTVPSYSVPENETVALWFNKSGKTKDDFRTHYASTIEDDHLLEFSGDGFTGMANGGERGITLSNANREPLSTASYLGDEVSEDLGKEFKHDPNSPAMATFRTNSTPSPGIIDVEQINLSQPDQPNQPPVITHQPVTSVDDNQNLSINVQIEDDQDLLTATVHYQTNDALPPKSMQLTSNGNQTYSAEIPAEDYLGSSLSYYIEVKDGTNTVTYPTDTQTPFEVSINQTEEFDAQAAPKLLITELTPNSSNVGSKDGFEFIEVYNNTNQEINMKEYKLIYHTPSSGTSEDWDITEDKVVPAQSSFVVWVKNGANADSTLEDFNANYGTSLSEAEITTVEDDGMSNSAEKTLKIADDLGVEFSEATYVATDVKEDSGVTYKYPLTGNKMVNVGSSIKANPGMTLEGQVPSQPVQAGDDAEAPVITHTPLTEITGGQDVTVQTEVTDNQEIQAVSLSYRTDADSPWTSTPMTLKKGSTYEATISKEALRSEELQYKIEATDGVNKVSTDTYTATIKKAEYDAQMVPTLLVTEVVPDSDNVNGLDGYEFIEIYNNSDKDINFKDYKIRYRYPMDGPEADLTWPGEKEDITIPSGETLVFWIINKGNGDKTVADFNENYQSQLVENQNIVKVHSDGMANGSNRGIVIATNTGKEIATSYYNDVPNVDDTAANKGILYAFPTNGKNEMVKVSSGTEAATPGTATPTQVPQEKVKLPDDTQDPTLEDVTNVREVEEKGSLQLLFDAKDNIGVKTVKLFYKDNEQSSYRSVNLMENYDDSLYHHTIYLPELMGKKSLEYYVQVSDGTNSIETDKKTISILGDEENAGLRLNMKDQAIVSKDTIVAATSSPSSYEDISLKIGNKDVTNDTYKALEKPAYFSFEVKKTNLFFKNGVTMDDQVLSIFDDTINSYVTMSVPIQPNQISSEKDTVISIRSGTKVSPFDTTSEENRDDFYIKNVRLVLSDGTIIYDPKYDEIEQELTVGDGGSATPTYDFSFNIPEEKFISKAYKWDTSTAKEGENTITATEGTNSISSNIIVDNSAPTIEPTVTDKKDYKGPFTLNAAVEDEFSGVTEMIATLDGKEITLPYETSSAKLSAGKHTFDVTAKDIVGNEAKKTVTFTVVDEHPTTPKALNPGPNATGIGNNTKLSVEVKDPTNDELNVEFYQGFHYKPSDAEVKVVSHAADTEPPLTLEMDGEIAASDEDIQKVSDLDGEFMTTTSTTKFPYQRFEVSVDSTVSDKDTVKLKWDGKSMAGRKVSMYVWNFADSKWDMQQWKVAREENFSLEAEIQGSDYLKDHKVQVLIQDEVAPEASSDYTMVWMSDTQYYSESYPHIYKKMVDWVAANKESLNIPYVFHTGDLVDEADDPQQWAYADEYMKVLEDADIPYGVLAGNHDVDHKTNDYTQYSKYFGEDRFNKQPYYGESYKDNRGHYDLVSANGNDFIMMYMGWGIEQEDIDWMNKVLQEHPDRMAILSFHEYLLVSGNRSPLGNDIFEQVVKPNKNVIAAFSGHYHDSETLVDEIDDDGDGNPDRKVYQMLADYQGGPEGGQGYMRLLHVNQADNKIYVKTYSPYLDDYNYYNTDQYPGKDEFVIDLPLQPQSKEVSTDRFEVNVYTENQIGKTVTAVDHKAEVDWNGLKKDQQYGWYVKAGDEFGGEVRSDVWTFTTGENDPGQPPVENPEPPTPGDVDKITVTKDQFVETDSTLELNVPKDLSGATFKLSPDMQTFLKNSKKDVTIRVDGAAITVPKETFALAKASSDLNMTITFEKPEDGAKFLTNILNVEFSDPALNTMMEKPFTVSLPLPNNVSTASEKAIFGVSLNKKSGKWQFAGGERVGNNWIMKAKQLTSFTVLENSKSFKDIQSHWAKTEIEHLASRLIIQGKTETAFLPDHSVTRAEFAVLLARMLNVQTDELNGTFKDVSAQQSWSAAYIEASHRMGIINGFPDGTFRPGQNITRQEMVAMIVRAMKVEDPEVLEQTEILEKFKDESQFSSKFTKEIYQASGAGLIKGRSNGDFDPLANSTRAETSVILYRLLNK
ncbi:lamin tail domain-containing protein [Rossellomorea vietnamensis]|uniref:lamin tail domain-containing protein n=1 Tax=Rossellomorea vietnamensis TaxID=218284 RepID=UPI0009EE421B|nr:lamin tail domain-containing protein [Rossellomorea vietnamensis]